QHDSLDDLIIRGPVELMLMAFQMLRGPLRQEIDAGVGDFELSVAKKNQDFFHIPSVTIRGVIPYAPEGSFGFFNYQTRTRYPYALLCSEISDHRLAAIERALELPAKQGIMALLALKDDPWERRTTLEPPGGFMPLTEVDVAEQGGAMAIR